LKLRLPRVRLLTHLLLATTATATTAAAATAAAATGRLYYEGNWPVVDELHVHHRAEDAVLDLVRVAVRLIDR
tara:strand:- start:113 stop:331 length:219 start_codon:yes stop_codon:yes gene_type:complete